MNLSMKCHRLEEGEDCYPYFSFECLRIGRPSVWHLFLLASEEFFKSLLLLLRMVLLFLPMHPRRLGLGDKRPICTLSSAF
jgi:hypothetical protein